MEITSSSGCGEKIIYRFFAGSRRSGRWLSSALALPPGQPVMVCCSWLNLSILIWYTGLFSVRSEEHTSELQSLMRISYAVFCFKKTTKHKHDKNKTYKIL